MKSSVYMKGYKIVCLSRHNMKTVHSIHSLVARAFLGNPDNKRCIDHKDNDKYNNHLTNLRYASHTENQQNRCMMKTNISGTKGVSYDKTTKKKASIHLHRWCQNFVR